MPKINRPVLSPIYSLADLPQVLERLAPSNILVVTDKKVKSLWLSATGLDKYHVFTLPRGEAGKSLAEIEKLWLMMAALNLDRKALVIALGGGAVCDAAGFTASTYKRGIRIINIPTTLLAMTDAAHGGKTGINAGGLKNVVGSFALPESVIVAPDFIKTQSERQRRNGLAEMLKHGLIASRQHWEMLWDYPDLNWEKAIHDSIDLKMKIASADFTEQGPRKALNFGHTFGHAIESLWNEKENKAIPHGYAIAAGMIMEVQFSLKNGLGIKEHNEIVKVIMAIFGKFALEKFSFDEIWKKMRGDKKNIGNTVMCTVLSKIGKAQWDCPLDKKTAREAWDFYLSM